MMRTAFSRRRTVLELAAVSMFSLAAFTPSVGAQAAPNPNTPPIPQIHATASEEVEIAPDRAAVSLAVESRAKTAAAAGAENARIQTAVLDTLRKLGIESRHIRTQGVSITPEYEYPRDGGRPTVIGYQARNTIQVELQQIARVGTVIDAALGRGATNVGGLHFFASNAAEARREAMKKAVARVRADAEAIAAAAGGSLGPLLEIIASADAPDPRPFNQGTMMMARAERADVSTPIEAGQIRVTANVSARFTFVPR
jgi:uncharacterized protein YggE